MFCFLGSKLMTQNSKLQGFRPAILGKLEPDFKGGALG
jgi:hypothetical protein